MNYYKNAVIPGDGIGNEVAPEGVKALIQAAKVVGDIRFEFEYFPWGCDYYLSHGKMMADDGLKILKSFSAIYFGAVGFPSIQDSISLRGLRLAICQGFDQYACVRPSILLSGIKGPLRDKESGDIDFIVVRENTEGEYAGAGGRTHKGFSYEVAVQTSVFTRIGVERVIRYAFELAQSRPRKILSSVTKSNAQTYAFCLWDEVFDRTASEYPEVKADRVLIDAMAARFVLRPESLDVVVGSNLFTDILTDLGGAICGSLGLAPSGNINPERRYPSMFEPVHGSTPDIYGKGVANPIAMIWCGVMMVEFLGEAELASLILMAIKSIMEESKVLTPDLGGTSSTFEVGDAVSTRIMAMN